MGDKGVWDETTVDRLKEQLGYVPDILPAKTVNVEKPAFRRRCRARYSRA